MKFTNFGLKAAKVHKMILENKLSVHVLASTYCLHNKPSLMFCYFGTSYALENFPNLAGIGRR